MTQPTPTLEYQSARDARWLVRAEADQVTLILEGAPAWRQLTTLIGGLLLCGAVCVASLLLALWNVHPGRWLWGEAAWPLACAGLAALFTSIFVKELRRFARFGPARPTYHLTSRSLSATIDSAVPFDGPDVQPVEDVFPGPGRLLFTGRRELLLRVALAGGTLHDIIWKGSRGELEQVADELREALRLDAPPERSHGEPAGAAVIVDRPDATSAERDVDHPEPA